MTEIQWVKSSYCASTGNCVEVGMWRKSSYSQGNGNCVEVGVWRKASASASNGACVEAMGLEDGGVAVRDTKLGEASPVLRFNADEWAAFLDGVRNNEFNA